MKQYAIYHNTTDYPGKFVCRGWTITKSGVVPDHDITGHPVDMIDEARLFVPAGLYPTHALPEDDEVIIEVWI